MEECYLRGQQKLNQEKRKVIYTECHQVIYGNASQVCSLLQLTNFALCNEVKGYGVQLITGPYIRQAWLDR